MIKYECEKCEREVYTEEAIGADVYLDNTKGTSFTFTDFIGGKITITYEDANAGLQQFCHACMFETIVQCLREKFPEEELIKMMGWAYKLLDGPKRTDRFQGLIVDDIVKPHPGERPEGFVPAGWSTGDHSGIFTGPAAPIRVEDATALPDGPFVAQVVPNDDTADPGSPLSDHELSELYAKGQLPEPRSNSTPSGAWRICTCHSQERDENGRFIKLSDRVDPACPVHSPGGSPGEG